jgi:phosphate transport system substrate-binding protein
MGISLVNQRGTTVWPITGATFVLMYKNPADKAASSEALKFFDWAFKNGKKAAEELDYVALPDSLTKAIAEKVWTQIAR